MSTEIYYFSGTGNSFFVAQELQKRILDATLIPIVGLLQQDTIQTNGKSIGIVFPVHALTIPIVVKKFLKKADLRSAEYFFAVATRLGTIFRGFEKIDQLLKKRQKRLDAHLVLNMGNNECRHGIYQVPSAANLQSMEKVVLEKLDHFQEIINNKHISHEPDREYTVSIEGNPVTQYFVEKMALTGMAVVEYIGGVNYFYRDSKCNGCGICAKVCLSEKIKMTDHKPVWQKKVLCYMCFACINYCPQAAVQIKDIPGVKSDSKTNDRYPHPYATVKDITGQKEI